MTASERSFIGVGKQTAKGTPFATDASFQYFLFTEGGMGPQNVIVPLDQEVGGGAMLRSMIKAGVTSGGVFNLIPRPDTIGCFLLGALGKAAVPTGAGAAKTHVFTLATDQFDAPYWTLRASPGGIWGEVYPDQRVGALNLAWKAADFVRGSVAFVGGKPTPNVSMTAWNAAAQVDKGAQFIAPETSIELPLTTKLKVLSGAVSMGMAIPLDDQWITGSYEPDDFDINSRAFTISLNIKVVDATLYNKMSYDPANGSAWLADILREANFLLQFNSDQHAEGTTPYSLKIAGNGQAQASGNANVVWTATPIAIRAGRQITMNITGTFLASPTAAEPITCTLVNTKATQY